MCSRCNKIETWEYAVKFKAIKKFRKEFIEKLLKEMLKNKLKAIGMEESFNIIKDMLRCIEEDREDKFILN